DGNLDYVGRNDEQIKLRGFRIELGEIETALSTVTGISQSCVILHNREGHKYLVGYFVKEDNSDSVTDEALRKALLEKLPEYMVPAILFPMDSFPTTITGKIDKKSLPNPDLLKESDYTAPEDVLETKLCKIWASVLNLDKISVTENFFRIGGDSIISIQLSGKIRETGYPCQVKDIFDFPTVRQLAAHLKTNTVVEKTVSEQGMLSGSFDLLPVQQWFFEQVSSGLFTDPTHWNHSFFIRVPELDFNKLENALSELVGYHDMFRVTFEGNKQTYHENITHDKTKLLDVSNLSEEEVQDKMTRWQSGFSFSGEQPLYAFGYLYGFEDGSAKIFMALHHLIVDTISWRLLAADLKKLYNGNRLPEKGSSYRKWVDRMRSYPDKYIKEQAFWSKQVSNGNAYEQLIAKEKSSSHELVFDPELTSALLHECPKAYHSEVSDLLVTVALLTLHKLTSADTIGMTMEGHGREQMFREIDHSGTLGWFTSMFPMKFSVSGDLSKDIIATKEYLRTLPNKGVGFGAFAATDKSALNFDLLPKVIFNYLGHFDRRTEDEWQVVTEMSGRSMSDQNTDRNLLNINGWTVRSSETVSELRFTITSRLSELKIDYFLRTFEESLTEVITHCQSRISEVGTWYTPVDFPFVNIGSDLLDHLQERAREHNNKIVSVYKANSLQQGFIYRAISNPEDDAYRVQALYDYRIALNVPIYLKAWETCIAEFPALRTAFNWEQEIVQIIYENGLLDYCIHDLSDIEASAVAHHIEKIRQKDREYEFDLSRPTLMRLHIIKQHDEFYTILKSEHHSISDGWSGPALFQRLHAHYETLLAGKSLPVTVDEAYPYTQEYIHRHRTEAVDFWHEKMTGIENANEINALLDKNLNTNDYEGADMIESAHLIIGGKQFDRLREFVRAEGITLNTAVQFAWHKLLQVYSGSEQSIVGTTLSGRDLPVTGIETSVGLYINTLPLVIDWDNDFTIAEQLQQIRNGLTELNSFSFMDLARLQKDGERLFQSLLIYENFPMAEGSVSSYFSLRDSMEKTDYPLSIVAYDHQNQLHVFLRYDKAYLGDEKAENHIRSLEFLLRQMVDKPSTKHAALSLLREEAYNRIIHEWNDSKITYQAVDTICSTFCEQARLYPEKVAIAFEDEQLTYRELDKKSDQLALHIREKYLVKTGTELQPDTLIAMYVDRSREMIVGILAILKAGGAYVPIDPEYPGQRIEYILEDTKTDLILTQKKLYEKDDLNMSQDKLIFIDLDEAFYEEYMAGKLADYAKPDHLAYVIYTSGTTGKPKGVMIEHRQVSRLFLASQQDFRFSSEDVWTLFHSYVFDFSVWEIWGALLYGGRLVIPTRQQTRDTEAFCTLCSEQQVTILNQTPSAFYQFADVVAGTSDQLNLSLKFIIFGGEALNVKNLNTWWAFREKQKSSARLINMYGITETTVHVTFKEIFEDETAISNIGKPLSDLKAYLLDKHMLPVPIGVTGELYIGGAGVARGYLNRAHLTEERFVPNPFSDNQENPSKLYKTGDTARWLPDGDLDYIGRNDDQVKIRGFRIELGEIEAALADMKGISQSCVLVKERNSGSGKIKFLAAYFVPDNDHQQLTDTFVEEKLTETLPDYMIPAVFGKMERFPLTINGKLDKKSLPDPTILAKSTYMGPKTATEKEVCEIWQEVLGVAQVGITDDFFSIGGDSILSIGIVSRMKKTGLSVGVRDLLKHRTISNLLTNLSENQTDHLVYEPFSLVDESLILKVLQYSELSRNEIQDLYPASYLQSGMIIESSLNHQAYHDVFSYNIHAPYEASLFASVWQQLVQKHEQLRSGLIAVDENYHNVIAREVSVAQKIKLVDRYREIEEIVKEEKNIPIDLGSPGLFKLLIHDQPD
ncbi:MAG: amino acid adenylation domain-containing protein, partial [Cyclobacteriaceae bacterium]